MSVPNLQLDQPRLDDFCRRWKVAELALFGSAARDELRPDSDIDILVTFQEPAGLTLFDLVTMQDELAEILGRPVDLVERKAVDQSPNYIRRRSILNSLVPIYAAAR